MSRTQRFLIGGRFGAVVALGIVVAILASAPSGGAAATVRAVGPGAGAAVQLVDEGDATALIQRIGRWSYVVAPLMMIVVAILPIPAELPAMVNGMIFGPLVGTTITWLGAVVGAVVSFELARRFGRPLCERFLKRELMKRADRLMSSAGWPGLLMLRLVPAVAFTALNWAAGLTAMRRWTFLWTTVIGILPGAVLFTSSGSGLMVLYRLNPAATWGLVVLGGLVVWWTVVRYQRRPLRKWTGDFEVARPDGAASPADGAPG